MKHPAQATGQEREFPQAGIIWALPGGPRQLEPVQSRAGGPRAGSCLSLPSGPWSSGRLPSSSALFLFCAEKAPRDLLTITLTLGCFGRFFLTGFTAPRHSAGQNLGEGQLALAHSLPRARGQLRVDPPALRGVSVATPGARGEGARAQEHGPCLSVSPPLA